MVSVLTIIDNYYLNRYCIETMLKHCPETEIELLVVNNAGANLEFLGELAKAPNNNLLKFGEIEEVIFNKAQAFNRLINESRGEMICVFDSHSVMSKNWLYDLVHYNTLIQNAGISAIPEFETKKIYTPLIDKNDEMVNVWKTQDNSVEGIFLFKKELVNERGYFNEENETGFLKEFSLSVSFKGKENFYVPGQCKIKV